MSLYRFLLTLGLSTFALTGLATAKEELTLYSGRGESLVSPLIKKFEEKKGIKVNVRYADTASLAVLLQEEGKNSPSDVYWAQDAGALSSLAKAGLLSPLPSNITDKLDPLYKNQSNLWVATSGRGRVLSYSTERVSKEALPKSVLEFKDPKYKGKLGWAPTNGSFQAFITGMRLSQGEEATKQWLIALKENGTQSFSNNVALLKGIADGKIDYALVNNYYLPRLKATDAKFPVEQGHFENKDIGNMMNVAGVAIPKANQDQALALEFIQFLQTPESQDFFVKEGYEYSIAESQKDDIIARSPSVKPDDLNDLQGTLALLREVGLL